MRQIYTNEMGSFILEPDEIPEFERDCDKIFTVGVEDDGTAYYNFCEEFDEKWEQWRIVPLNDGENV